MQIKPLYWTIRWIPILALIVPMLQYAIVMPQAISNGTFSAWKLSDEITSAAGGWRYLKDAFYYFWGIAWPFFIYKQLSKNIRTILTVYFIWICLVLVIGLLPYMLQHTPLIILIAGLRWIVLLHGNVGIASAWWLHRRLYGKEPFGSTILSICVIINLLILLYELRVMANILSAARFGATRLPGLFGNAGVVGALAVSVALMVFCHRNMTPKMKIIILIGAWLIAGFSGSRFAMFSILILMASMYIAWLYRRTRHKDRPIVLIMTPLLFSFVVAKIYKPIMNLAGRGDLISTQLHEGGRIYNFFNGLSRFFEEGTLIDNLFGAGLGVGTNSAFILASVQGYNPYVIRFNWLIDNSAMTLLFQLGVLGSSIFWGGGILLASLIYRLVPTIDRFKIWVLALVFLWIIVAGNIFEQSYLLLGFATALGSLIKTGEGHKLSDLYCKPCHLLG